VRAIVLKNIPRKTSPTNPDIAAALFAPYFLAIYQSPDKRRKNPGTPPKRNQTFP